MRTVFWLIALLVNCSVIVAFMPGVFDGDVVSTAVSAVLFAIGFLLIAARMGRTSSWGDAAMTAICTGIPIALLVGSLDLGRISGLEFYSLVVALLFAWGMWKAFRLFHPRPNIAVNTDASRPLP